MAALLITLLKCRQLSWSVLPDIILLGLVNYLPTLDDIVRLGCVCRNWRIFLCDFLRFLPFSDPPLLLSLSDDPILLKRITASGLYRTQIPCVAKLGNRWLGSSFGNMIFMSWNRSRTECRITISDPIKGSNIVSPRLPNVKLPYHHAFLTSPICSPECILILFFYGFKSFYFSRIGVNESCWNTQSLRVPCQVVQTFYSKTHRKIFAIDDSKEVNILEISITGEPFYQKLLTASFNPVGICKDLVFDRQHFNPTVVECGKEMLLILFMQKHRGGQISKIEIYKLNFLESTEEKKETRSWTKFNEVLDYAIFIDWGGRNPVALRHPQRWGGKVNTVYLTGPGCTSWMILPIGVDLEDPTYSQHNSAISADSLNSFEKWPSNIWIYPSMCFQEQ